MSCFRVLQRGQFPGVVACLPCLPETKGIPRMRVFSAKTKTAGHPGLQSHLNRPKTFPAEHVREHPELCCPMGASISLLINTLVKTVRFIETQLRMKL